MLGVMQGRLSVSETGALQAFPRREWREEFPRASAAGFDSIEWLYDVYGEEVNPLASDGGIGRLRELSKRHGIAVRSLCVHYLLERPDELDLEALVVRCRTAGIERVVLPFLEGVELDVTLLTGPEIVVESDLEPQALLELGVPVNYDTGNSAALGRDPRDELAILGPLVRGVHLKDRDAAGNNVPLGTGIVDFRAVFEALEAIGYDGDLVCETPRPDPGAEIEWGRRSVEFVSTIRGR